ncbi:uncharacterized protein LOC125809119 [Solanum verrucosum]|uniref:uncharacterized protein LOC125809119 n=1 Tax=Solanum verrucosum TaxID=315347 RepID=UPI0020D16A71|nr:uncharacterized protein LOC125809119 [Solanum verrucosum]
MAEDSEIWKVICEGPYVPTMEVKVGEITRVIPKTRKEYNDSDKQLVQKNYKAKKLLMCGLSVNEYDLISSCESAKEIWDLLRTTYEGTEEIRKSILDLFITQFDGFTMKKGELIHEMRTRFSTITDELMLLEEQIPVAKQVSRTLEILPRSCTNDFVTENETREPDVMTMYTLFEYLQVHEMHRKWEVLFLKGKDKRTYLIDKADQKKENHDKATNSSEVCGKCDLPGYSIGNCPMHKADHMKSIKNEEGKDKEGDQVRDKLSRREAFFQALKKDVAAWENSSSDSDDSEHSNDAFMGKSDKEDADEKLTTENVLVNNSLDISQDEKIALVPQISDIENQMVILEAENLELKEKIKGITNTILKGKNEGSSLQLKLENKLHTAEMKMKLALERNLELERDLVRVKEELEKSLKWTNSSKILTDLIGQGNNSRRGLGCKKIDPPYNPHSKSVSDADNLSCVYCGRDGHLRKDCPVLKKYGESSLNYSHKRNRLKKGPGLVYRSKLKKTSMPHWTKDFLITPLSAYWELRLKWVPKANK